MANNPPPNISKHEALAKVSGLQELLQKGSDIQKLSVYAGAHEFLEKVPRVSADQKAGYLEKLNQITRADIESGAADEVFKEILQQVGKDIEASEKKEVKKDVVNAQSRVQGSHPEPKAVEELSAAAVSLEKEAEEKGAELEKKIEAVLDSGVRAKYGALKQKYDLMRPLPQRSSADEENALSKIVEVMEMLEGSVGADKLKERQIKFRWPDEDVSKLKPETLIADLSIPAAEIAEKLAQKISPSIVEVPAAVQEEKSGDEHIADIRAAVLEDEKEAVAPDVLKEYQELKDKYQFLRPTPDRSKAQEEKMFEKVTQVMKGLELGRELEDLQKLKIKFCWPKENISMLQPGILAVDVSRPVPEIITTILHHAFPTTAEEDKAAKEAMLSLLAEAEAVPAEAVGEVPAAPHAELPEEIKVEHDPAKLEEEVKAVKSREELAELLEGWAGRGVKISDDEGYQYKPESIAAFVRTGVNPRSITRTCGLRDKYKELLEAEELDSNKFDFDAALAEIRAEHPNLRIPDSVKAHFGGREEAEAIQKIKDILLLLKIDVSAQFDNIFIGSAGENSYLPADNSVEVNLLSGIPEKIVDEIRQKYESPKAEVFDAAAAFQEIQQRYPSLKLSAGLKAEDLSSEDLVKIEGALWLAENRGLPVTNDPIKIYRSGKNEFMGGRFFINFEAGSAVEIANDLWFSYDREMQAQASVVSPQDQTPGAVPVDLSISAAPQEATLSSEEKHLAGAREKYRNKYKELENELAYLVETRGLDAISTARKIERRLLDQGEDPANIAQEYGLLAEDGEIIFDLMTARREYDSARREYGEELYASERSRLEASGKSGRLLQEDLARYKAGEIFNKLVIEEAQALAEQKIKEWPPQEKNFLEKFDEAAISGVAWALQLYSRQNRATKIAISTAFAGVFVAAGGGFATAGGVALFLGARYVKGLALSGASAFVGKKVREHFDEKFGKKRAESFEDLKNNFSLDNLDLFDLEYGSHLKSERNEKIIAALSGVLAAGGTGFLTGFLSHGLEQHLHSTSGIGTQVKSEVGQKSDAPLSHKPLQSEARPEVSPQTPHTTDSPAHNEPVLVNPEKQSIPIETFPVAGRFVEVIQGKRGSVWNAIRHQMDGYEEFKQLKPGQQANVIDNLKEEVLKKVSGARDSMPDGTKLDLEPVFKDPANIKELIEHAKHLDAKTVNHIEAANKTIADFHTAHPDVPITTANVDAIAEGHYPGVQNIAELPASIHQLPQGSGVVLEPHGVPLSPDVMTGQPLAVLPENMTDQDYAPPAAAPDDMIDQDYVPSPEKIKVPLALKEMMRSGEFADRRNVPVGEFMHHVPSYARIDADNGMWDQLKSGELKTKIHLDGGAEKVVSLTERDIRLADALRDMKTSFFKGPIYKMSLGSLSKLL